VGFVGFGAVEGAEHEVGEVHAIYLLERAAGAGIGHELFSRAVEQTRRSGFQRAHLWVLEVNDRARRFYERAGWNWDGTRSTHRLDCNEQPVVRYAADLSAITQPDPARWGSGSQAVRTVADG
jgi:ribosomal protein S18 acetylase RimI-like enzyme